jgi:hypothetical protein
MFYALYKIQQNIMYYWRFNLRTGPWKSFSIAERSSLCTNNPGNKRDFAMWSLGELVGATGELRRRGRSEAGVGWPGGRLCSIWGFSRGGGAAGKRAWRRPAVVAAASYNSGKQGVVQVGKQVLELEWIVGRRPRWSVGSGVQCRGELGEKRQWWWWRSTVPRRRRKGHGFIDSERVGGHIACASPRRLPRPFKPQVRWPASTCARVQGGRGRTDGQEAVRPDRLMRELRVAREYVTRVRAHGPVVAGSSWCARTAAHDGVTVATRGGAL